MISANRLAAFPHDPHNRRMNRLARTSMALVLLLALAGHAIAQDAAPDAPAAEKPAGQADQPPPQATEPPAPIYDEKLLRLSEILGSLSFLRDLCGASDGPTWRDEMTALLAAEKPAPHRRARLIARFNHGFETFNAVYRTCTPSAELSIGHYLSEGAALASDVRGRYNQ
jgi:uncharacterized protein (TIGR02301 family)